MWPDSWLRDDDNFRVETPVLQDLEQTRVHDLWIPNCREWDIELLGELFIERDARVVASIPLSSSEHRDSLIWHFDKVPDHLVHYLAKTASAKGPHVPMEG